jgi:hypothetical protein
VIEYDPFNAKVLRGRLSTALFDGLAPVFTPWPSVTVPSTVLPVAPLFTLRNRTFPVGAAPVGQGASGLQTWFGVTVATSDSVLFATDGVASVEINVVVVGTPPIVSDGPGPVRLVALKVVSPL